jgi:hypothetical protein
MDDKIVTDEQFDKQTSLYNNLNKIDIYYVLPINGQETLYMRKFTL